MSPRCLPKRLQDVFKTFWNTKHCYTEDVLKTFSGHVLKTSSGRLKDQQMFAGKFFDFKHLEMKQNGAFKLYDTLYDTFYNHSFCDILNNELRVIILTSCVYCTSYELWVVFTARVKSYCLLHELQVTFYMRVTRYCLLHMLRVTLIVRVTSYYLLH